MFHRGKLPKSYFKENHFFKKATEKKIEIKARGEKIEGTFLFRES